MSSPTADVIPLREQHAAVTRRAILQAAQLLAEQGFTNTTVKGAWPERTAASPGADLRDVSVRGRGSDGACRPARRRSRRRGDSRRHTTRQGPARDAAPHRAHRPPDTRALRRHRQHGPPGRRRPARERAGRRHPPPTRRAGCATITQTLDSRKALRDGLDRTDMAAHSQRRNLRRTRRPTPLELRPLRTAPSALADSYCAKPRPIRASVHRGVSDGAATAGRRRRQGWLSYRIDSRPPRS